MESGKKYLKNQLPVILINLLGMLFLSAFLMAIGNEGHVIVLILFIWILVLGCYLSVSYYVRKKYLDKLLAMTEQLEERYLIAEIVPKPERVDDAVYIEIMKMAEKSMLERIAEIEKERREYKEYIEQWIHEVKTPLAAMKLLSENNRLDFTRELLAQLERVNHYTEQALYYARSEHTEKDYIIRETDLVNAVHNAIADNKYLLRQKGVAVTVDEMEEHVYTDDKWLRFILNQLIGNAVKYCGDKPLIHVYSVKKGDMVSLMVEDNGIGIAESDLPRIYDKGFTGNNGRTVQSSTGIGLYLCRKLCDKLGIGLEAVSDGKGTTVILSFHINDFVAKVQG